MLIVLIFSQRAKNLRALWLFWILCLQVTKTPTQIVTRKERGQAGLKSSAHLLLLSLWSLLLTVYYKKWLQQAWEITLPTKIHIVKAIFPVVMYRCELDHKEGRAPKNWCFWTGVEDSWVSWTARSSNQSILKESSIHWKDWCWSSSTLATWWEELTHWKRPWCWERLKTGGEGDNREWDG